MRLPGLMPTPSAFRNSRRDEGVDRSTQFYPNADESDARGEPLEVRGIFVIALAVVPLIALVHPQQRLTSLLID